MIVHLVQELLENGHENFQVHVPGKIKTHCKSPRKMFFLIESHCQIAITFYQCANGCTFSHFSTLTVFLCVTSVCVCKEHYTNSFHRLCKNDQ